MMHLHYIALDVCQNFTGSSSTDINLCLVWVVWEGLSRFREVENLVHGSMHIVLPLELMKRFQSWLWYSSPQNMEAEVLEAVLSLAVWAVQHTAVLSCVELSYESWNSPRGSWAWQDSITLDSTRRETDLWWCPCLPPKQISRETQEKVINIKHVACHILA